MSFIEELLLKIVPIITTSVLAYLFGRASKVAERKDKEHEFNIKKANAIESGMRCLLRIQLISLHDKYQKKGCIPIYGLDNFKNAYEAYRDLGGNGTVTHMFEDMQKLPIQQKG